MPPKYMGASLNVYIVKTGWIRRIHSPYPTRHGISTTVVYHLEVTYDGEGRVTVTE